MKRTLIALMVLVMALPSYAFLDFDYDGIDDQWEWSWFRDFTTANDTSDYDGDGLTDYQEFMIGTYPVTSDTDRDGMPDRWEVVYGYSPTNTADGAIDTDHDGVVNSNEYYIGSHPSLIDTDHDGLTDSNEFYNTFKIYTQIESEVFTNSQYPYNLYTNYVWVLTNVTIPVTSAINKDGDKDGVSDFNEVFAGTNPNDPNDYFTFTSSITNGFPRIFVLTGGTNRHGIPNGYVEISSNTVPFITITWQPALNRGYDIMMTTNLLDNNSWTNITRQASYDYFNNLIGNINYAPFTQNSAGFFATNANQLCSWTYSHVSDNSNAYYKVKVSSWFDRSSYHIPHFW